MPFKKSITNTKKKLIAQNVVVINLVTDKNKEPTTIGKKNPKYLVYIFISSIVFTKN